MKKTAILSLIIFSAALSAFTIPKSLPKPTADFKGFDIESISLRDINFLFDVEIKNPYPVGLKLDGVEFTFFVENNQFFKTTTSKGLKISAKGKKLNQFRVNVKYEDIIKIVKAYSKKDYLNCKIDMAILIPLPDISGLPENIRFDYSVNTQIPAIKPTISIANFKVQKPSTAEIAAELAKKKKQASAEKVAGMFADILSGKKTDQVIDPASLDLPITVDFDILLKNETAHKLVFNSINYDFLVNNEKLVKGTTKDIKMQGNTSIIKVSNKFSSKSLGKSMLGFFEKQKGDFAFTGSTFINLPEKIKKDPLKLSFDEKGKFNAK
ncbi:MAG TPA: LEA type 2 family protein [Spirochaetota bacterium]|nr:LEA type 2 family protein [Spirochaetota bacterium]HQE58629.1 LEA type 2 family protein [Spirochaetota bacterium]